MNINTKLSLLGLLITSCTLTLKASEFIEKTTLVTITNNSSTKMTIYLGTKDNEIAKIKGNSTVIINKDIPENADLLIFIHLPEEGSFETDAVLVGRMRWRKSWNKRLNLGVFVAELTETRGSAKVTKKVKVPEANKTYNVSFHLVINRSIKSSQIRKVKLTEVQ